MQFIYLIEFNLPYQSRESRQGYSHQIVSITTLAMPLRREMIESQAQVNGNRADSPNGVYPTEDLDAVIVGAG